MLQPDASLPETPLRPAPWMLDGAGWVVAVRLPAQAPARDAFMAANLAGRCRGMVSWLMYVDYDESPCGPYRELLFIPGTFPFQDGRRHLSISRILVSTWSSVVNGRRNWGIPKDRADFEIERTEGGALQERLRVLVDGREICALEMRALSHAPSIPVHAGLVPGRMRTLAQQLRGRTYYYAPSARGRVRPARLLSWRFDGGLFPDLGGAKALGAVRVESFRMCFPVATVTDETANSAR